MAGNTNFQIKVTLQDANLIRRALQSYHDALMKEIEQAGGPDKLPTTAADVGSIETLLRRDF